MTEQQQSPGQDPAEAYATEYRRLWDATVATLTAAVQLDHPQHGPVDFSDFLASALGAVAANVGSANRITAGRPGISKLNPPLSLLSQEISIAPAFRFLNCSATSSFPPVPIASTSIMVADPTTIPMEVRITLNLFCDRFSHTRRNISTCCTPQTAAAAGERSRPIPCCIAVVRRHVPGC